MPICRPSRTACCAAATERGRPMLKGMTAPGNRTKPRTGTISSSFDSSFSMGACGVGEGAAWLASDMLLRLVEPDEQAAIDHRMTDASVDAGRQRYSSLETSLRQLQSMDESGRQLRRQAALAGDDQRAALDLRLDLVGVHPRQGGEDEYLRLRLQHVDRRLPADAVGARRRLEKLLVQPFGARHQFKRVRPHTVSRIKRSHAVLPPFPRGHPRLAFP